MNRRDAMKLLGGAAAWLALPSGALAKGAADEFFIFIHAAGGWDVTLWADPRNRKSGIVDPPTIHNTAFQGLPRWKTTGDSFEILGTANQPLGPAIGALYDLRDRLTIVNGIAMNTVSHEDGTTFSTTGRHRTGGTLSESSVDVLLANELGRQQLMPAVAVRFPSAFVGNKLDHRAVPLRVGTVDAVTKSFERSSFYFDGQDRSAIAAVLSDEARSLARTSTHPELYERLVGQHADLQPLLAGDFTKAFSRQQLQAAYPQLPYGTPLGENVVAGAFAIEAIKRNVVRCVGFGVGALDTHDGNHRLHGLQLQDLFALVTGIVKSLDATPHPTKRGAKLSDHTHILVVSEFCRTPQLNPNGGRDHYPNNSALIISPRFRAGRTFGATDEGQLLPRNTGLFAGSDRAMTPADLLATYLGAFGVDHRRYMRDGEVVKALLA